MKDEVVMSFQWKIGTRHATQGGTDCGLLLLTTVVFTLLTADSAVGADRVDFFCGRARFFANHEALPRCCLGGDSHGPDSGSRSW